MCRFGIINLTVSLPNSTEEETIKRLSNEVHIKQFEIQSLQIQLNHATLQVKICLKRLIYYRLTCLVLNRLQRWLAVKKNYEETKIALV